MLPANKRPTAFFQFISKNAYFHDWYIKSLYVANTGKEIVQHSKKGLTTIQIEFCTSNNDISYLLVFIDAHAFHVSMETSSDVSNWSFTNFGRCDTYTTDYLDKGQRHLFCFEGGATIDIICDKVKYKKIF